MATRDKVLTRAQFGIESTPGTAVATVHEFTGLNLTIKNETEVSEFQKDGQTYVNKTQKVKASSKVEIKGVLTVDEFGYLLTSAFGAPTTAAEGDAYKHTFTPKARADRKAFTFKKGDATGADVAAGCYCQSLSYEYSADDGKVDVKATFVGQPVVAGTLSSGVETTGAQVSPLGWTFFHGTSTDIGDQTETSDVTAFEWSADDLIGQTQFSGTLKAGTGTGSHEVKATAATGDFADDAVANIGTTNNSGIYVTTGATVDNYAGGATDYSLTHILLLHFKEQSEQQGLGEGNILGYDLDGLVAIDSDGFSESFELVNGVSSYTS